LLVNKGTHYTTPHRFGSRDVIGHVTIGLTVCGFLEVVHCNKPSISHH